MYFKYNRRNMIAGQLGQVKEPSEQQILICSTDTAFLSRFIDWIYSETVETNSTRICFGKFKFDHEASLEEFKKFSESFNAKD